MFSKFLVIFFSIQIAVVTINVNVEVCADEENDDKKTKLKMVGRWQVDIWSGMSGKMHCFSMLLAAIICPGSITFSSFKANKNHRESTNCE